MYIYIYTHTHTQILHSTIQFNMGKGNKKLGLHCMPRDMEFSARHRFVIPAVGTANSAPEIIRQEIKIEHRDNVI